MALRRAWTLVVLCLATATAPAASPAAKRPHGLPPVDLKQPVIWGSTCTLPDGSGLSFGGEDQTSDDGQSHTRVLVDGKWKAIDEELRKANPRQQEHDRLATKAKQQKDATAQARQTYFDGQPSNKTALTADTIRRMSAEQIAMEQAAEALNAEPPPRALSPLVYDPQQKVFILFGGDHLDYLTNDLWTFDPAAKRWHRVISNSGRVPPPRANHRLSIADDGKLVVTGGYTYASNTDYCGGQYVDLDDGPWTFDWKTKTWSGGRLVPDHERTYRTGPLHPDFYLAGPKPDAAAFQATLEKLPANTWVMTRPPHLPKLNRDWGTATLDPHRDLILRFSGGHSAHGGTDVLHYHMKTNRWELPFPVEFPLGQLYSNTSYPEGFNFNRRPWVTGHTYQNYGYDLPSRRMLFTGQTRDFYLYDPDVGDWIGRGPKPEPMSYNSCFYTLTACTTPDGLVVWTQHGRLFRYRDGNWEDLKPQGVKLPGSSVDNSTVVYDSKRQRLVFARKDYGEKNPYDGQLHAMDLATREVTALSPKGMERAAAIPYLCQIRYDAAQDVMLVGATLPPDADGRRATPAYDCAANRWVRLKIAGDDPSGKAGRNVSLGMMYDARRKLFWAVDTNSHVFVLRLDVATAGKENL